MLTKFCNYNHCRNPEHFHHPQKKFHISELPVPSTSHLLKPINPLFVSMDLPLWTLNINRIIEYVAFYAWFVSLSMFSGFISSVA